MWSEVAMGAERGETSRKEGSGVGGELLFWVTKEASDRWPRNWDIEPGGGYHTHL